MKKVSRFFLSVFFLLVAVSAHLANTACLGPGVRNKPTPPPPPVEDKKQNPLAEPREKHLGNIKQLTFGGENAEAYFSFDGKKLIFQTTRNESACDQIFTMNVDGSGQKLVSTGQGRCTCSYYLKDGQNIIFSSTHLGGKDCPARPDFSKGYVWALYPDYDIFTAKSDGSGLKRLTTENAYDAEATVSPDGKKIIFTSDRTGDLELFSMDVDGKNVRQLTNTPGYDGGAFYSPDNKMIVYRASHPKDETTLKDYQNLLKQHLIRPTSLEIMVMNADGSNQRQITSNGKANFAPFFLPNGKQIIFSSNMDDPKGRNFDLYVINLDGTSLERITYNETFDGFPMFSPDGKKLVFASNRNGKAQGETNIFIADWLN